MYGGLLFDMILYTVHPANFFLLHSGTRVDAKRM